MRNATAKRIRKGCIKEGLTRSEYKANKETYKGLNRPFKKALAKKIKAAKAVQND